MAKWSEIRKATLGKTYDLDKAYGGQCWDYVMYVLEKYYGGKRIHCGVSGYVKDIANQRKTNGILNYCTDVGLSATLVPGDICVWGECAAAPKSHIAIYDHDEGQSKVYFCGQNQKGVQKVTVERIDVSGIIGVFRPKKGLEPESTGSETTKKTVSQLADEVIAGKWGTGETRKEKLEAAGYDYEKVQAAVNKKMGVSSSASTKKPDQVLSVGSVVTSVAMKLGSQGGVGYKKINGDGCVYVPDLGGWFPTRYLDEYDASDGKKDNYLANTNAKVVVAKTTVQAVDAKKNLVKIYGIWVDPTPLTELKDGK